MMNTTDVREEQVKNFNNALVSGALRDLAIAKGGTGHLRKELSLQEQTKKKAKRKQAKMSRKANR